MQVARPRKICAFLFFFTHGASPRYLPISTIALVVPRAFHIISKRLPAMPHDMTIDFDHINLCALARCRVNMKLLALVYLYQFVRRAILCRSPKRVLYFARAELSL